MRIFVRKGGSRSASRLECFEAVPLGVARLVRRARCRAYGGARCFVRRAGVSTTQAAIVNREEGLGGSTPELKAL